MISSLMLLKFYKWWWNVSPIPGCVPSVRSGLCTNLAIYARILDMPYDLYNELSREMDAQFTEAGLCVNLPFNSDVEEYSKESHRDGCYYNPARRQWVQDRIKDMEGVE